MTREDPEILISAARALTEHIAEGLDKEMIAIKALARREQDERPALAKYLRQRYRALRRLSKAAWDASWDAEGAQDAIVAERKTRKEK